MELPALSLFNQEPQWEANTGCTVFLHIVTKSQFRMTHNSSPTSGTMCCLQERADQDSSLKKRKRIKPLLKSLLACCIWDQYSKGPSPLIFHSPNKLIRGQLMRLEPMLVVRFPGKTCRGCRESDWASGRNKWEQPSELDHLCSFEKWWQSSLYIVRPLHWLMLKTMLERKWEENIPDLILKPAAIILLQKSRFKHLKLTPWQSRWPLHRHNLQTPDKDN